MLSKCSSDYDTTVDNVLALYTGIITPAEEVETCMITLGSMVTHHEKKLKFTMALTANQIDSRFESSWFSLNDEGRIILSRARLADFNAASDCDLQAEDFTDGYYLYSMQSLLPTLTVTTIPPSPQTSEGFCQPNSDRICNFGGDLYETDTAVRNVVLATDAQLVHTLDGSLLNNDIYAACSQRIDSFVKTRDGFDEGVLIIPDKFDEVFAEMPTKNFQYGFHQGYVNDWSDKRFDNALVPQLDLSDAPETPELPPS